MGDPKKPKAKFSKPSHPWQATRLEQEKKLVRDYGLKSKKEVWKAFSFLKQIKAQAKKLIASTTEQTKKEEKQLLEKLARLNILQKGAKIEDILDIDVEAILKRRLQTIVFQKGFARTPIQARQFIVHGHIAVNENKVNVPSYMVPVEEEGKILFVKKSKLSNDEHPERVVVRKEKSKIVKPKKKITDRVEKTPKQPPLKKKSEEEKGRSVKKKPKEKQKKEKPKKEVKNETKNN